MKKLLVAIPLLLSILFFGRYLSEHKSEGHDHLLDKIRKQQKELSYPINFDDILDTSLLIKVHADLPEVAAFFTEKRSDHLISFPCSNCHNQPLEGMQINRSLNQRKSHWNIHLSHAGDNTMNCTTCHAENDMDKLSSLTGQKFNLDESYKLCGQCHSTQYKDWQGGAHGKQLNGWTPPRVAKTCVGCHNPHKPAFPSRFPARLNTNDLSE